MHPVVLVFAGCQVKTWPVVTVHVYTPNINSTISILRFFRMLISADEISECVTVVCIHYSCDQYTDRISTSEREVCAGSALCCAVPQETKATETVCAEPAPAATRRRRTGKRVAPAPAVSYAAPAPLIEYAASEPAVTDTAPAPAPAVTSGIRASVIEPMAPVPAVTDTAPVPVSEHVAPAPGVTSAIRAPAPVTKYASTCPAASKAAASVAAARTSEEAFLAELLKTAAHTLPDLSAAAASDAAARANGEALLAGLMETEANLADLAAQSLLIEEAQQAARVKKKPKGAQQGAQAKKKPKTKR